jgi:hypothetical protein
MAERRSLSTGSEASRRIELEQGVVLLERLAEVAAALEDQAVDIVGIDGFRLGRRNPDFARGSVRPRRQEHPGAEQR